MTAPIIAAAIIRREKDIVEQFRAAGALSPDRTTTIHPAAPLGNVAWRRLVRHEVVRPGPGETFYLDEARWDRLRVLRRRLAMSVVVVALLVLFWVFTNTLCCH
jgi:hypothetical protein